MCVFLFLLDLYNEYVHYIKKTRSKKRSKITRYFINKIDFYWQVKIKKKSSI